ncbi:GCN5-like N-acetyltransferase [Mycobacterium sp. MFM001]|uniref:N-acetylglutamate synthase, CG3035 family n=1 Tax=Mycobacterium sp. MFM001 TaxID=2049453 RepID=UPI000DA4DA24|nr:GNAT family N-acetyltransferase [Mycobacterium sp. MFM001]GBE65405.1 GCN5-like N-acetyltransferase [Mycobacterium sp. MFM001]
MVSWPDLGTRVTVRYRRAAGSVPPLTDAVGHLLAVAPLVRIRTKSGEVVQFSPDDVVVVRALTDAPVRNSQIRAVEHAAALAWPGLEQQWLDGWLLRAAPGASVEVNSAVPLDVSATNAAIPAIVDWYTQRGLTPWLAVPDRLLRLPDAGGHAYRMLVRDVSTAGPDPAIRLTARPDDDWLRCYRGAEPVEVLTAVLDGELAFGLRDRAAARAAVTDAPDGTRWVGLSAVSDDRLCEALLAWGASRGATRGYVRVLDVENAGLVESLGFTTHHRGRYFEVHTL